MVERRVKMERGKKTIVSRKEPIVYNCCANLRSDAVNEAELNDPRM